MDNLYNIDAEEALIGALLIDPSAITSVAHVAQPDDIYIVKWRWAYQAMLDLTARGQAVDVVTVSDELKRQGRLDEFGGLAALTDLLNATPSSLNVMSYAKIVQDLSRRRQLQRLASGLAKAAHDPERDVDDALDRAALGIRQLFSPQQAEALVQMPDVPVLPLDLAREAEKNGAAEAGQWLDRYVEHAQRVAPMTPEMFHESAGLWLLSVAVARRLVAPMAFGDIYPSLWVAWLAPTTLWTKTTALNVARSMARATIPFLLSPEEITPESMIADMSGARPVNMFDMTAGDQQAWQRRRNHAGQRGWSLDEFSGLLASAGRDYNAGLLETLLLLYDCTTTYTRMTQSHGMQTIHDAYLSLLCASTPTAMAQHLTSERLWGMGWWPRFALLTPTEHRPSWRLPKLSRGRDKIAAHVRSLYERLPEPTWPESAAPLTITFGDGVYDLWARYNRSLRYDLLDHRLDHRLWGSYGRLPVGAIKVATLLAAADWDAGDGSPRIEPHHMTRAMLTCERWRASAHRALILATVEAEEKLQQRILYQIARRDTDGATFRDIYKSMRGVKNAEIREALECLIDLGEVLLIESVTGPQGGRPADRYYLSSRSPLSSTDGDN